MPVATKTKRCPSCGTKNPAETSRCRICTRALPRPDMPSQTEYENALYSEPIAGASTKRRGGPALPVLLVAVAGLLGWNYFSLGYGPSWAHRPAVHEPGGNWRTFREVPAITAQLPGSPIVEKVDTEVGHLTRARVGVDDHWDAVIDSSTRTPAAIQEGVEQTYAVVVVGSTQPLVEPASGIPTLVASLAPGLHLSESSLVQVEDPGYWDRFDLVSGYRGYPEPNSNGTVRARVVIDDTATMVVATLSSKADSASVHDRLVAGFTPDGAR